MSHANRSEEPAVQAIYVTTDKQRLAFGVVDAVDDLQSRLAALRAVGQLAANDSGSDHLPQLRRGDLAMLIGVLGSDLEAHCTKARDAAALAAKAS
jgi:hypothetical protein